LSKRQRESADNVLIFDANFLSMDISRHQSTAMVQELSRDIKSYKLRQGSGSKEEKRSGFSLPLNFARH
jgi:hypothetical protein